MSIYKRGNNYYIDYYFHGRKRLCTGPDRKTAELVLAKTKVEIAEGKYKGKYLDIKVESELSLFEVIDDYLLHSENKKRSFWRDRIIAEHVKKFFVNVKVKEINGNLLDRYINSRKKADHISNSTINREIAFLRAAFYYALDNGKIEKTPIPRKKKLWLSEPQPRNRILDDAETIRLIAECSEYLRPIVICFLTTTMRKTEALTLKWSNVDMENRVISVIDVKNRKPKIIPICDYLYQALKECQKWTDGTYVFCNEKKAKYKHVDSAWRKVRKATGIKDFRMHDLRHMSATFISQQDPDPKTVQEILGHTDLKTTSRYLHSPLTQKHAAMVGLNKRLESILKQADVVTKVDTQEMAVDKKPVDNSKTSS